MLCCIVDHVVWYTDGGVRSMHGGYVGDIYVVICVVFVRSMVSVLRTLVIVLSLGNCCCVLCCCH